MLNSIMETSTQNLIGNIFFFIFCLGLLALYGRNLYKLVIGLKTKNYEIKTFVRAFGVVVPVVGILMGLV